MNHRYRDDTPAKVDSFGAGGRERRGETDRRKVWHPRSSVAAAERAALSRAANAKPRSSRRVMVIATRWNGPGADATRWDSDRFVGSGMGPKPVAFAQPSPSPGRAAGQFVHSPCKSAPTQRLVERVLRGLTILRLPTPTALQSVQHPCLF